jgi:hypothetical protein
MVELLDEPLLVTVPDVVGDAGRLPGGDVLRIGNAGLLDRTSRGSGLLESRRDGTVPLDGARDGPELLDLPRGASRYGAIGDVGEGGPSLPLDTG